MCVPQSELRIGIDEAGYGPLIGPMVHASVTTRVPKRVDVWDSSRGVIQRKRSCVEVGRSKLRSDSLVVGDSKALKLSNTAKLRHPLIHLERGALAFLSHATWLHDQPANDHRLLEALSVDHTSSSVVAAWTDAGISTVPIDIPLAEDAGRLRLLSNALQRTLAAMRVEVVRVRIACVWPKEFNERVERMGSKAALAGAQVLGLLRRALREDCADNTEPVSVAIDRQGGAKRYASWLGSIAEGGESHVSVHQESATCSSYSFAHRDTRVSADIEVGADTRVFEVALASMYAKYVRELAMLRLNKTWSKLLPDVNPTAGYGSDAKRWIGEVCKDMDSATRRAVVRSR